MIKNYKNICKRIKKLRQLLKLTQQNFAVSINTTQSRISKIEKMRESPSKAILESIMRVYGISPNWLLAGSGGIYMNEEKSYETLPLFNTGMPDLDKSTARASTKQYIGFKKQWIDNLGLDQGGLCLIEFSGDSMAGIIEDKSLVMIDTNQKDIQDGKIIAVELNGSIMLKKALVMPEQIILRSSNKEYSDIVLSSASPINIIGSCVWCCKEL